MRGRLWHSFIKPLPFPKAPRETSSGSEDAFRNKGVRTERNVCKILFPARADEVVCNKRISYITIKSGRSLNDSFQGPRSFLQVISLFIIIETITVR